MSLEDLRVQACPSNDHAITNCVFVADAEYAERGDDSDLHIIIFDEIDSVCKQRGSSRDSTGVGDTVVNQLLSKIDVRFGFLITPPLRLPG